MLDLFGDLRSALHREPSPQHWEDLAHHLMSWPPEHLLTQALPYVLDHMDRTAWGQYARPMPAAWDEGLRHNTLSMELACLVRALTCPWPLAPPSAKRWVGPYWQSLESLTINAPWSHATLKALAQAQWPSLQALDVSGHEMDDAQIDALSHWNLPALRALDISGCPLSSRGLYALSASGWWAQLERLKLGHREMTGRGASQLSTEVHMPNLHHLHVHNWSIDWPSAFSMSHAPWAQNIQHLGLTSCGLGADELRALFVSHPDGADAEDMARDEEHIHRKWPDLCHLDLKGNRLGRGGMMHLGSMVCVPSLQTLDLSRNTITAETLFGQTQVLERASELVTLNLSGNPLGSAIGGIEAAQAWANLRHLDVSSLSLRDPAPLSQGILRQLHTLNVGSNPFETNPLEALFAHSPMTQWENLRALHMANTRLKQDAVCDMLLSHEAPKQLKHLDLRFNELSPHMMQDAHPSWAACTVLI